MTKNTTAVKGAKSEKGAKASQAQTSAVKKVASTKDSFVTSVTNNVITKKIVYRTDAIHAVLLDAYAKNETLKTTEIVSRARKLLGADHEAYEKLDRTINAHLYTLQGANGRTGRESVIEKVNGAWRLNAYGASLLKLKAPRTKK